MIKLPDNDDVRLSAGQMRLVKLAAPFYEGDQDAVSEVASILEVDIGDIPENLANKIVFMMTKICSNMSEQDARIFVVMQQYKERYNEMHLNYVTTGCALYVAETLGISFDEVKGKVYEVAKMIRKVFEAYEGQGGTYE